MKRSRSIRLLLIGSLTTGAFSGCGDRTAGPVAEDVFTNNHYLHGSGYYHAPFRRWYHLPYNEYDPSKRMFFQGGEWAAMPHRSIVNISAPTPEAIAQSQATHVRRGGFGGTSHRFSGGS